MMLTAAYAIGGVYYACKHVCRLMLVRTGSELPRRLEEMNVFVYAGI
jgi:hypothetical protein